MLSARQVAKYFLLKQDEDSGDLISNLKLQKLVYYAQGFHLAAVGEPLFDEAIEAWMHGPVVRSVYAAYAQYGGGAIPVPTDVDMTVYDAGTSELLEDVYSVYGQFSAWKLRNMTHDEPPWKTTPSNNEITHDKLIEYFSTQIN